MYCNVSFIYVIWASFFWGRLRSVVVKADAHYSAGRRRRIREGSNPACDYKKKSYILAFIEALILKIQVGMKMWVYQIWHWYDKMKQK